MTFSEPSLVSDQAIYVCYFVH